MRVKVGIVLLSCLVTLGCKTTEQYHGSSGEVAATYAGTDLNATLPPEYRVPAVLAAADEALRSRGLSIYRRDVTESSGVLYAEPPEAGPLKRTVVHARTTREGTKLTISYQPWGDDAKSRALLDDVLQRLGV